MTRLQNIFIHGCLVIIAGAVILSTYLSSDGILFDKPFSVQNGGSLATTQSVYHAGDAVQATGSFCKYTTIPGTISWELIDTYIRFYEPVRLTGNGCYHNSISIERIPIDTPPGAYEFKGTISFRMNALTTVYYQVQTNQFTVASTGRSE